MSTLTRPRNPVKPIRKPLTVELTLTINGVAYAVTPIAPGPDNVKAYRLAKCGADEKVYDLCQTAAGLVECDCPSYEVSYRGNGLETCKHGRACIMAGLVDYLAFAPLPDEFDEPARDAYNDAREKLAQLEQAEQVVRAEGEAVKEIVPEPTPAPTAEPESLNFREVPPARVIPAFDRAWHLSMNAVAERRGLWLTSKPAKDIVSNDTPAARQVEEVPCCDPVESMPCEACVDAPSRDGEDEDPRYGPQDDGGGGWDAYDDDRWAITPPAELTMVEMIEREAARYRSWGTDLGDLLAERTESLIGQIRALDATTPEMFRDRRDCMLDCAMREAEARLAAARYRG